jgi:hypothetical protein
LVVNDWVSDAINNFPLNCPIGANFVADEVLLLGAPNEAQTPVNDSRPDVKPSLLLGAEGLDGLSGTDLTASSALGCTLAHSRDEHRRPKTFKPSLSDCGLETTCWANFHAHAAPNAPTQKLILRQRAGWSQQERGRNRLLRNGKFSACIRSGKVCPSDSRQTSENNSASDKLRLTLRNFFRPLFGSAIAPVKPITNCFIGTGSNTGHAKDALSGVCSDCVVVNGLHSAKAAANSASVASVGDSFAKQREF